MILKKCHEEISNCSFMSFIVIRCHTQQMQEAKSPAQLHYITRDYCPTY